MAPLTVTGRLRSSSKGPQVNRGGAVRLGRSRTQHQGIDQQVPPGAGGGVPVGAAHLWRRLLEAGFFTGQWFGGRGGAGAATVRLLQPPRLLAEDTLSFPEVGRGFRSGVWKERFGCCGLALLTELGNAAGWFLL